MVNTTGLHILYGYFSGKHLAAGQRKPYPPISLIGSFESKEESKGEEKKSDPFMFSFPRGESKCHFQIASSEWSKGLSLDCEGMLGMLELNEVANNNNNNNNYNSPTTSYQVAVSINSPSNSKVKII